MPAGVRAMRSTTMTGFCASTSILAACAIAAGIALRRRHRHEFGNAQAIPHRGSGSPAARHRATGTPAPSAASSRLVGAHRRLGEMLQRGRLVVPLGEVANDLPDIDAGMDPLGAGPALVGLHDIAAHARGPARGRTRRCTSPWWRAAGRRRRGRPWPSACLRSWRQSRARAEIAANGGLDGPAMQP